MRILLADDHDLFRDALTMFLATEDGFSVSGVGTFAQAKALIEAEARFDLVILDYNMPGMNRLDGLAAALAIGPGQRVALMSGVASKAVAEQALALGAAGFIPKTLSAKSLVSAVKFMAMGEIYVPVEFLVGPNPNQSSTLTDSLTPREREVLVALTKGRSNKEIARTLGLQEPTVKLHLKTLFRKIGATNRTQAAMIAQDAGIE
jgi:two-component system, NarL family, nitrate/nitrite response regulator NarL